MHRNSIKRSRATLPALLIAAGCAALQVASGCGRANSSRLDSETHWLTSCDTDLDCGAGSCECGVCSLPCSSGADCSVLGFAGVECVAQSGLCGASPGAGSACLLPCVDDTECSALGSRAVCESQRCGLPASFRADGVGATGSTSEALLCDGSDDVRFLLVRAESDGLSGYPSFAGVRGGGFLAIDGQCRFWSAAGATFPVTSGTLSPENATAFARAIGYARLAEYAPYNEEEGCMGLGGRIWSPLSRAQCGCSCYEDPDLEGWLQVINAPLYPEVQALFANGQTLTSPLRLALIGFDSPFIIEVPLPWPLSRRPAENEIYHDAQFNPPLLDESSGVEITDPLELSALRAARDANLEREPGTGFTPLVWMDPDTRETAWFHMVLRDELPAHVQAALERPLF